MLTLLVASALAGPFDGCTLEGVSSRSQLVCPETATFIEEQPNAATIPHYIDGMAARLLQNPGSKRVEPPVVPGADFGAAVGIPQEGGLLYILVAARGPRVATCKGVKTGLEAAVSACLPVLEEVLARGVPESVPRARGSAKTLTEGVRAPSLGSRRLPSRQHRDAVDDDLRARRRGHADGEPQGR